VLVPTDYSPAADRALETALDLVAPNGRIDLVNFWHIPGAVAGYRGVLRGSDTLRDPVCRGFVENAMALGAERVKRYRAQFRQIEFSHREELPASGIMRRLARIPHDLVVMGSAGRRGLGRWFLGSVAEATVRHAACSVVVVHAQPRAEEAEGVSEQQSDAAAGEQAHTHVPSH
jgi:nucleotide-binding universal stress UspA family protein